MISTMVMTIIQWPLQSYKELLSPISLAENPDADFGGLVKKVTNNHAISIVHLPFLKKTSTFEVVNWLPELENFPKWHLLSK